ncbi:hypothetical protein [Enterococcus faecium]|nr:hypothetical protein [Enterococcus faecium]
MIKLIGKETLKVYYVAETKAEVSRWLLKMFSKTSGVCTYFVRV